MQVINHYPYVPNHIGESHDTSMLFEWLVHRIYRKLNWCVLGGTLLGLVRGNKLIPTDTDYDIAILVNDGTEEHTIRELFSDWQLAVEVRTPDGKVQQLAYYPNERIVDFHFYYPFNDGYRCYHQAGQIYTVLGEIETVTTRYGFVKMPQNRLNYLKTKYGADWMIPKYQQKGNYKKVRGLLMGCFDPLHYGHINMIRQCYQYCQELVVVVRTDEHIKKYKGHEPFMGELKRCELMHVCADQVELSANREPDYWVKQCDADLFFVEEGRGAHYALDIPVIEIPRTPGISSTLLRNT